VLAGGSGKVIIGLLMDHGSKNLGALEFRVIDFRAVCSEGCGNMARRIVRWLDAQGQTLRQRELCLLHCADAEKRARKVGFEIL
jgi:hypothetical protein